MAEKLRITIKGVAQAAGVSTQTVSRVLNDRPDVAPETRQRVKQIIEQYGFQPSALARSLIQQRSYTLGVVTAGLQLVGPRQALNGIAAKAEAMGYTLLLKELPEFLACDPQPILNSLLARQVDGILWAVPEVGENHCWLNDRLPTLHIPILFLSMAYREGVPSAAVANFQGGYDATQHLLEQGVKRVGHISGPLSWWESRERKAGWEAALLEAGLPVNEDRWVEGDWSPESGHAALESLLQTTPGLQALFVANDQMAVGALHCAHTYGLRVPQDLAIVGFDDIPEAAYTWPPLSTVHQDLQALGSAAVGELVTLIEAQKSGIESPPVPNLLLRPRLIPRASSILISNSMNHESI